MFLDISKLTIFQERHYYISNTSEKKTLRTVGYQPYDGLLDLVGLKKVNRITYSLYSLARDFEVVMSKFKRLARTLLKGE